MAIDWVDRVVLQTGLSAVQQKNTVEEERRIREKNQPVLAKRSEEESEILLVEAKEAVVSVENSDIELEKVSMSSGKHRNKQHDDQIVQESYLGKNVDLKG